MRILFCGDVVGRAGRKVITGLIPELRKQLKLDFVVVNGENAASGFGITQKICDQFLDAEVDVITGGDHIFDRSETRSFLGQYHTLLRPANFPEHIPGKGVGEYETADGRKVVVIHLLAQVFMRFQLNSPFECADKLLEGYNLGKNADVILVDFHGEATSEKMAMGHYLDGRVSLVVGSHTHVPTADALILPGGTAYQTDAGMCGDYNSVIGFEKATPLQGFIDKARRSTMEPALGEATLAGVYVETDDKTGLAKHISPVRMGGVLAESVPDVA